MNALRDKTIDSSAFASLRRVGTDAPLVYCQGDDHPFERAIRRPGARQAVGKDNVMT
jgi:hypothetical protein